MNEKKLIDNVIGQIKEAQLKLGFEREVIHLYFPVASLNLMLGTAYRDGHEMLTALKQSDNFANTVIGPLDFDVDGDRIEVRVSPEGAEYVAKEVPDPEFLKAMIGLFASNDSPTIVEICQCFGQFDRDYICEKLDEDEDFDFVIHFLDAAFDPYFYCIKMEMGHTIYHRFSKEDYAALIRG